MRNPAVRTAWKWLAPLAGLAALALAVFLYLRSPSQRAYRFSLSAGNEIGVRHRLAERFQGEVAGRRITLDLRPSLGSEQSLDWVNERKVDLALVLGCLTPVGRPDVRQVATLHIEPMHLLVRPELFREVSASLTALSGKNVEMEEVGSGTHTLANAVLQFAGLEPKERDPIHGYVPLSLGRQPLLTETDAARLPDAVFLISTMPSPTAAHLVRKHGYRLAPLPFADAFALGALAKATDDGQPKEGGGRVVRARIQATVMPAYAYSLEPPVPEQPLPTLGTRLLLVAHKDVPARAAYELVEAVYASELGQNVRPPLDVKLMDLPPEFPWHEGAELFLRRNSPLLSGAVMDSARNSVAILAAGASGLFVLWQWMKMQGQFTRGRGLSRHIAEATRIEARALEAERGQTFGAAELHDLHGDLCRLKTSALDEFAREGLAGKELLAGFLLQVNDVRDRLTRLLGKNGAADVGAKPDDGVKRNESG